MTNRRSTIIGALGLALVMLTGVSAAYASSLSQTVVISSNATSAYGSAVTFTATVTPSTATGNVTFYDGNTTIGSATVSNGIATFTTSSLSVGMHPVSVYYAGDANDTAASSAPIAQTVLLSGSQQTAITVNSSSNPSTYGGTVTLSATVSPSGASGTVTFYDGGVALGTAALNAGVATYTTSSFSVGTHSIGAMYSGDTTFIASASPVILQTVNTTTSGQTTTTSLTSGNSATSYGNTVVLYANVSPVYVTGYVTFYDNGVSIGSTSVVNGMATLTTSSLNAGTHTLTAMYGGTANYGSSTSSALSLYVNGQTYSVQSCSTTMNNLTSTISSATDTLSSALKSAWQVRASAVASAVNLTNEQQVQMAVRTAKANFDAAVASAQQQYSAVVKAAEASVTGACTTSAQYGGNSWWQNGIGQGEGLGRYDNRGQSSNSLMLLRLSRRRMMRFGR